ncbi:MAG: hypothetical protein ABW170_01390 [Candidatus Thiodiazotropha sp. L084R]
MLALYPLWRKARRVYSLTSRLPGTNRLGFQPSLALSEGCRKRPDFIDHLKSPTFLLRRIVLAKSLMIIILAHYLKPCLSIKRGW